MKLGIKELVKKIISWNAYCKRTD